MLWAGTVLGPLKPERPTNDAIISLSSPRRLHRPAVRRQPARRLSRRPRPRGRDDAGDRQGDELLGDDLRAARRAAGHRRADADLHARRGAADGRPPDHRQRVRARARRRDRPRPRSARLRPRHRPGAGRAGVARRRPQLRVDDAARARRSATSPGSGAARRPRSGCRRRRCRHGAARPGRLVRRAVPVRAAHDAPRRRQRRARPRRGSPRCATRRSIAAHGVFLFSAEPGPDKATVYSRMFAPDLGVAEDPATGSASGPLGCYLVRHKRRGARQGGRC